MMSLLYITTQGAKLRSNAGRFLVTKGDAELESVPHAALDGVILLGHVQVTTQAVHELLERGIGILYLTGHGRFRGILQPGYPRNVFMRMAQYEASLDSGFSLETARRMVIAKIETQEKILRKWLRNGWLEYHSPEAWGRLKAAPESVSEANALRGTEAQASVKYFEALGQTVPPPFSWHGRNRQPPRDPVNALLSFTYMLAVGEAVSTCYAVGLDPFIGFLHELDYSRPSLALDLIEPLRATCCDHLVMRMLQRDEFTVEDFEIGGSSGCRMQPATLRRFITAWESDSSGLPTRMTVRRHLLRLCRVLCDGIRRREAPDFSQGIAANDGEEM